MGYKPATNAVSSVVQRSIGLSRFLTPRHFYRRNGRVATLDEFTDVHRSIGIRAYPYLAFPHTNYVKPRGGWVADMAPDRAHLLGAHNMEARISFLRHALHQMRRHPDWYCEPLYFVTLSPRRFVLPLNGAAQVDLCSLKAMTRQALAGLPFIGMVDFLLLKSWGDSRIPELDNAVSAHTHCLVVGHTYDEIKAACRAMGPEFVSLTGGVAEHIKKIKPERLEGYLCYMLKLPLRFSRVQQGRRWRYDSDLGRYMQVPRLRKIALRTGDQLRMAAVLRDMYLDELFFGQGAGTEIVRAVRADALAPLRHQNELRRLGGTHPHELATLTLNIEPASRGLVSDAVAVRPHLFRRLRRGAPSGGATTTASTMGVVNRYFQDLADL